MDRMGLHIPPPPAVIEFAEEFGLAYLIETHNESEAA